MLVLDNTDVLEGGASVDAVVDYTFHGLVGSVLTQLAAGVLSDTLTAALYTAGDIVVVTAITLVNTHSAAVNITLRLDPADGGNPRYIIPETVSLGIGYSLHTDGVKLAVFDASGQLLTALTAAAHKDNHDPEDGSDPLDCAAPAELAGVQAAAEGTAHSFARSDHAHQIQESMADNHIVTINQADVTENDYAKFTATGGLSGRSYADVRSDINVADGADVTANNAPQAHKDSHDPNDGSDPLDTAAAAEISAVVAAGVGTSHSLARADHIHAINHGITDNHILTVDGSPNTTEHAIFTADGIDGKTDAELLALLSGDAGAAFDWNDQILQKIKGQTFTSATELTIDTGAVTVTQAVHTVDTAADAASDDLDTINGGTTVSLIMLRPAHTDRTVVVKHNTGNIVLQGAADITLDDITDHVLLFWDTTNSKWVDFGGGSGDVATDTIWDAAGDLAVGTGADTAGVLTIGAAGSLLGVNAGATTYEAKSILVSAAGEMTNPSQPCFLATPTAVQSNIAIADVTVLFGTEVVDQGSDFASSTFTAPVTGNYALAFLLYLQAIDFAATYYTISIITSNRTYQFALYPPISISADGDVSVGFSVIADMDAADTALVRITQAGGTQQTDIESPTFFSGALIC